MRRFILILVLGLMSIACSRLNIVEEQNDIQGEELCFTAYLKDMETRTVRQENGDVFWSPGDAVSLFFNKGDKGGDRFVAQNKEVASIAEFKGTITGFSGGGESVGGESWFWAVYPYSADNSCDGSSVTLTLPYQQEGKAGSFANGHFPTMAKAKGLELGFYNICSGFKFTVSRDDIKAVEFKGNADENLAGKVKVIWDENARPAVSEYLDGKKEIRVGAPADGTFVPGEEYYIVLLPELLSEGFTMTFVTTNSKEGSYKYAKSHQLKRSIFVNAKNLDERVTEWIDADDSSENEPGEAEGGTESGLYLGISTFDKYLRYHPVHLISEASLESYNAIVDGLELTTENGTVLYYSIDEDITSMKSVTLPEDLYNVSIVTFTDGLDEGSLAYRRGTYKTKAEYLDALHTRLRTEKVSGQAIHSYAVGLVGPDAESNMTEFKNNLEKIASPSDANGHQYVYEISDIKDLNSVFESIADQLSQNIRVQKVEVSFPYTEEGERKRFTLDNKPPGQSSLYIEGVVHIDDNSGTVLLSDMVYYGLSSTSGTTVPVTDDNGFDLVFNFEGIQTNDGSEIQQENIALWYIPASGTNWQQNSEFSPDENVKVYTELKSALVLLNLDLSKSLTGQLPTLKEGAKHFLSNLYKASVDPNVVKAIKLNKNNMALNVGQSETIQASVAPSTASTTSLKWSSSLPSVATVDQSGMVTAVSEGTTIVSVVSEDEKVSASCTVQVTFKHVESVTLNKTDLNLFIGKTATLSATCYPADASETAVIWTSSDPDVATVSSSGVVVAHSFGTTTITAATVDGALTASCKVSVTEYIPSSDPIDLSLAVRCPEREGYPTQGYIPYQDLQYVDLNEYGVIGLTVLSNSGDFIMALEDASDYTMYHKAADYYRMPTYEQGVTISVKWNAINEALTAFGAEKLTDLWTAELHYSSYYCYVSGSGGTLDSSSNKRYVREVIPLQETTEDVFITKSKGIYMTYSDVSGRHFVESIDQVPAGCTVDGVAVSSSTGKGNVIIASYDALESKVTWSSADEVYDSSNFLTLEQAYLLSARWKEVNAVLAVCGEQLGTNGKTYWTQNLLSGNSYYILNGYGCSLSDSKGYAYVRFALGTF